MSQGPSIEIRLFGGFEVAAPGAGELESQKVRALLAYLVVHADRALSREHLATLLWPDGSRDGGRRNLRQALYNLRQALPGLDPLLRADHTSVTLATGPQLDADVVRFLADAGRGLGGGAPIAPIRRAVELYRGDFLAGFFVRDSPEFEDWLTAEQERLREKALRCLRVLIEHLAARGEYDEAVALARRRVEIDPLAEAAHCELMRLYVLAGRRPRALAQYEELTATLARELGVAPHAETRELYRRIVDQESGPEGAPPPPQSPVGPVVPLVGRRDALAALSESWHRATAGGARLALVEGAEGIGKTRLIKTFLGRLSAEHRARVAHARRLDDRAAREPLGLAAALEALTARDGAEDADGGAAARPGRPGRRPAALFVDDLRAADHAAWEELAELLDRWADRPLWLVVARRAPAGAEAPAPLAGRRGVDRVALGELAADDVAAIAAALVGDERDARRLAGYLEGGGGLPLALVERINALCDEGVLAGGGPGRWSLEGDPAASPAARLDLDGVIAHRLRLLPSSTRRLLVLAAAIGPVFDVELLQRAADEHAGVVEIALEVALQRWLVRQHVRHWSDSPRERDLVLWAQGVRRGRFEFAHPRLREVALGELPPDRRRGLHRQVAAALAALAADGFEVGPELLALHRRAAGEAGPAAQNAKRTPR